MGKLEDFVKKKSELTNKILDTQIGSSEFVAAYKEYKTLFTSQIANTCPTLKQNTVTKMKRTFISYWLIFL